MRLRQNTAHYGHENQIPTHARHAVIYIPCSCTSTVERGYTEMCRCQTLFCISLVTGCYLTMKANMKLRGAYSHFATVG